MGKQELESLRDIQLDNMEARYRDRENELSDKMEVVKSEAAEKSAKGEDISAEKQEYDKLHDFRDYYYDQYREERNQVWEQYQDKIDKAQEKENEQENDYSY